MPRLQPILFVMLLFSFAMSAAAQSLGDNYAHFFYVTDFQPGWEDLPETSREARKIGQVLESDYNFSVQYHREVEKADILRKIKEINERSYGKNDQVLFFFSMHGHFDKAADRGYLVPADGKIPRQDSYGQTWLSYDDLGSYITKNLAEHVLLALDACYSGAFGDRYRGRPGAAPWEKDEGNCREKAEQALAHNSRLYFSSGSRAQRTPAQSLFAKKWLEALRNGARSGLVTTRDLRYYLDEINYPSPEGGSFTSRHKAGGDFVFLHRSACEGSGSNIDAAEQQLWAQAQRLNTEEAYTFYLQAYPNGRYRTQAEAKIKAFERGGTTTPSSPTRPRDLPDMIFVEGGTFQMGSSDSDAQSDETTHTVTVDDFYMHRFEVTNAEFAAFLNAKGRHEYNGVEWYDLDDEDARIEERSGTYRTKGDYGRHPVTEVTWYGAVAYCNWKSEELNLQPVYQISGTSVSANWNADGFRLPTEAEWEFAARSRGKDYKYAWGSGKPNGNIADESAKKENSGWTIWEGYDDGYAGTAPVGMFEQGTLGFSDLTGNVWEWCWDWYDGDYYKNSPSQNPRGPSTGSARVNRGGGWGVNPQFCRAANRFYWYPTYRNYNVGVRLAHSSR